MDGPDGSPVMFVLFNYPPVSPQFMLLSVLSRCSPSGPCASDLMSGEEFPTPSLHVTRATWPSAPGVANSLAASDDEVA
jgi:hypothetical protein